MFMSASSSNEVRSSPAEPRYQPLVIVLAAAAAGILADRFRPLPLWAWWTMAVGGLAVWVTPLVGRRLPKLLLSNAALLLSVAATMAAWHHCRWYLFAADDLGRYAHRKAQPICVEATAVRMPRTLPTPPVDPLRMMPPTEGSRLDVDLAAIRDGSRWRPASGRATLLVQGPPPQVRAGDRLRCFAHLSAPLGPQNPGAFDYAAYLRAEGVHSRLKAEVPQCVSVVRSGGWLSLAALLDRVARPWQSTAGRLARSRLRRDGRGRPAGRAGTSRLRPHGELHGHRHHPPAGDCRSAPGHLGRAPCSGSLRRTPLPRRWAVGLVAAATVFYMFLVDAGPPVVRATVLVLVTCAAAYGADARCRSIRWPPRHWWSWPSIPTTSSTPGRNSRSSRWPG